MKSVPSPWLAPETCAFASERERERERKREGGRERERERERDQIDRSIYICIY